MTVAPAGSIPDDIGNLTLLSDLHLDHNSLSGKSPLAALHGGSGACSTLRN
jgi:hypothetical protein